MIKDRRQIGPDIPSLASLLREGVEKFYSKKTYNKEPYLVAHAATELVRKLEGEGISPAKLFYNLVNDTDARLTDLPIFREGHSGETAGLNILYQALCEDIIAYEMLKDPKVLTKDQIRGQI